MHLSVFDKTRGTRTLLGPVVLLLLHTETLALSMYTCTVDPSTSVASPVKEKSQNLFCLGGTLFENEEMC